MILLVSLFITVFDNQSFFTRIIERLDVFSFQGSLYVISVYLIIFIGLALIQFVFGFPYILKIIMIILLISSAILSYFIQELGVIFDVDMVRNIVENIKDSNQQEALELLSAPLIQHVVLLGVLPAIAVILTRVSYKPLLKEVFWRIITLLILLLALASFLGANFKFTSYFSRENRDLRVYITPLYAIDSIKGFIRHERAKNKAPLKIIGADAKQLHQGINRRVGIMLVGETARWDHFSLNGYLRETNPELKKLDIINYANTSSCGTSTAYSVPCMFSFLDANDYSPSEAATQTNVLDVLKTAGVEVYWIDNNSSCKGVCKRIGEINMRKTPDPESAFYKDGQLFDEAMINQVDKVLANTSETSDVLIVLHMLGSHGPKYYKRYPDKFSQFKPACHKATPQECTDKEIINAYDNTILYTDYVLKQLISYLKTKQSDKDTFLIYASDHGESLGENGVYLHGLPKFLAPEAQTHVPMLTWFSKSFIKNENLDLAKMNTLKDELVSHDNLSHTILSAFDIKTSLYQSTLDLIKRSH